jgi:predicted DCC family thiol-disulfide oxidoreductase YuxK
VTGTHGNPSKAATAGDPGDRWALLFDGHCRLCRRSVAILIALDWFGRVRPVSFRDVDLPRFNRVFGSSITPIDADREMYLVRPGRALGGYDAYRRLALLLPALWPVAPLLWLPGVSHLGRWMYRWVADRRLALFGRCDDACRMDRPAESSGET